MKLSSFKLFLVLVGMGLLVTPARGVSSLYWSFDTTQDGTGAGTAVPTDNDNFGTPGITAYTPSNVGNSIASGGQTYTHEGSTWSGTVSNPASGRALLWGTSNTTAPIKDIGFIVTMSTVDLYDLNMRFDIRSATASTSLARPPSSFKLIEYRLDDADPWTTLAITSPVWANGNGTPYSAQSIDLSSFNMLENQATLQLRFQFSDGTTPSAAVTQNIRIDNLLFTAVPEPGVSGLLMLGMMAVGLRRRRQ